MRIRVFDGYLVEPGKHIPRGIYEADDPKLYGRAQYLVDNRHAEVIGEPAAALEPVAEWALTKADFQRLIELMRESDIIQQAEMVTADTVCLALEASLGVLFHELETAEPTPPEEPAGEEEAPEELPPAATVDKALTEAEVDTLADESGDEPPAPEGDDGAKPKRKKAS